MARKRGTNPSAAFRARVARAALKGDRTAPALARPFGIHPNLISNWRGQPLKDADPVFAETAAAHDEPHDLLLAELCQQTGRLDTELAWLNKNHDALGCAEAGLDRPGVHRAPVLRHAAHDRGAQGPWGTRSTASACSGG